MADGTHDNVKLNVRVTPSKKQGWKDALDEDETLSSLVRRAVDRELSDEYVPQESLDEFVGETDQTDIDLSAVMSRFDDLQQTVEALEGKFDSLSVSSPSAEEQDIEELAMDLLPRVPSYPDEIPEYALRAMEGNADRGTRDSIKYIIGASREDSGMKEIDGTAQKLAREIREPTPPVREALCYLETETTEDVKSAIIDGKRHWMRL